MYQLFSFPLSQHSRRVISLLEEVGIPYENHNINLMANEHMSESYLKINPNHKVPTFIDGDVKIHESNAILRYLCIKHQLFDWYPNNTKTVANVEQWLDWNQCQLSPLVVDIVLNRMILGAKGDQNVAIQAEKNIQLLFTIMEEHLEAGRYLPESIQLLQICLSPLISFN
ncbi:MAG: glutathione S-transferase family protein [Porticoccaceae bacterium]